MQLSDRTRKVVALLLVMVLLVSLVMVVRRRIFRVSEERVREQIVATVQREAQESFLVTGSLDITATTTIENSRVLLPNLLDLKIGTSRATVQVPGRAYYGFDVRALKAGTIRLRGDTIHIDVPVPGLLSVEPNLEELKIWSSQGWLRSPASVRSAEHSGLRRVQNALRRQATTHLATSTQPHVNTARALQLMLEPVVQSLGIENPVFRFRIGETLVVE